MRYICQGFGSNMHINTIKIGAPAIIINNNIKIISTYHSFKKSNILPYNFVILLHPRIIILYLTNNIAFLIQNKSK